MQNMLKGWKWLQETITNPFLKKCLKRQLYNRRDTHMDNLSMLNDVLHTEMMNQMHYNKYMMDVQNPELRQMFMQMRDSKMQQITQLQQEIKKKMQQQQ